MELHYTFAFSALFRTVLWHCWMGDRKSIRPVKIWVLVSWWWRFDWSFAHLIAPVVTTTSSIICSNKIQNRSTWKMVVNLEKVAFSALIQLTTLVLTGFFKHIFLVVRPFLCQPTEVSRWFLLRSLSAVIPKKSIYVGLPVTWQNWALSLASCISCICKISDACSLQSFSGKSCGWLNLTFGNNKQLLRRYFVCMVDVVGRWKSRYLTSWFTSVLLTNQNRQTFILLLWRRQVTVSILCFDCSDCREYRHNFWWKLLSNECLCWRIMGLGTVV